MNVLGLCGSLRKASTNQGLLRFARDNAPEGMNISLADISQLPFYNADIVDRPESVTKFFRELQNADALIIACNEYNYSLAPALKNALDWASRETDNVLLDNKAVAIMGAGGGMGSSRAQYHLRQILVFLNMHPLNKPEVFVNAFAGTFDDQGNLTEIKIQENIKKQLAALKKFSECLART